MMINNSYSYKRGVAGFYQQLKSFWSCNHMNCYLQIILYINLHILYIIQVKQIEQFKNQENPTST